MKSVRKSSFTSVMIMYAIILVSVLNCGNNDASDPEKPNIPGVTPPTIEDRAELKTLLEESLNKTHQVYASLTGGSKSYAKLTLTPEKSSQMVGRFEMKSGPLPPLPVLSAGSYEIKSGYLFLTDKETKEIAKFYLSEIDDNGVKRLLLVGELKTYDTSEKINAIIYLK